MKITGHTLLTSGGLLVGAFVAIQLVPIAHDNPPVETDVPSSADAHAVLKRACYDCHSNETVWPWYSRVAPVSWLVARDVREGRKELNFSTWNRLATKERVKLLQKSFKEVDEGEMPPWFYLPTHPDAKLSPLDRDILRSWTRTPGAPLVRAARSL